MLKSVINLRKIKNKMKIKKIIPSRKFKVGKAKNKIEIKHSLDLFLNNNEQVTLKKKFGNKILEYDVCAKDWGYYALPSINSRLKKNKFTTFLVINDTNKFYIHLVANCKKKEFKQYLKNENQKIFVNLSTLKIEKKFNE